MNVKTSGCVALILAAIIAANLSSSHWGPGASIYNAFFLVGIVLSTKDYLYDAWGSNRVRNTALLIATGSVLSYAAAHWFAGSTPPAIVKNIALGSLCAFAAAETWDTIVYARLKDRPWLERSNTSNIVGAAIDSSVFVLIAFSWSWPIVFGQFCAKVAGGYVWSLVIEYASRDRIDLSTDAGALRAVRRGYLKPHEAPMAVLRDAIRASKADG